jgi:glycosyltransferase involved in cell wall biosynthesis
MVSVVIGVYNGADSLRRTLDSIFSQDLDGFEVVVVDDGSTDATADVLDMYAAHSELRIVRLARNGGLTQALIAGVAAARGGYIARIDAGDIMIPSRLSLQSAHLDAAPEVGVVASQCDIEVRQGGEVIRRFINHVARTHEEVVQMLPYRTPIIHASVMFRKDIYNDVGGYDASLSTTQDYDLWIRMAKVTRFIIIDEALTQVIYDVENSITYGRNKAQIRNSLWIKLRAIRQGALPVFPTVLVVPKHFVMLALPLEVNERIRQVYRTLKRWLPQSSTLLSNER